MSRLAFAGLLSLLAACAPSIAPPPRTSVATLATGARDVTTSTAVPPTSDPPEAAFRATPPALPPLAPFTQPPIRSLRLSNGARVLFLEQHVPAMLRVELVLEATNAPLGANAMAARDVWLGTATRTADKLIAARDAELAQPWTWAGSGVIEVGLEGLSSRAEETIALLAEVALTPTFPKDLVLRANVNEMHDRERHDDVPQTIAARVLPMALYGWSQPEDDLATLRASDVGALVRDDVARAYEAALDPTAATLVVVGDTSAKDLLPMLERSFGKWKRPARRRAAKPTPATPLRTTPRLVVIDRPRSPESHVLFGGEGPSILADSNEWASSVVMMSFFESKMRTFREAHHAAWAASTRFTGSPSSPRVLLTANLPSDATASGLRAIERELRDMKDTDVAPDALGETRERIQRLDPGWLVTLERETEVLNATVIQSLPAGGREKFLTRVSEVTVADVRRVASSYLDPDRMKIVIVGDWAKLRPELVALGWGPIELRNASGAVVGVDRARGTP